MDRNVEKTRHVNAEFYATTFVWHWDSNPGPQPPLAAVGLLQSKALILDFQFDWFFSDGKIPSQGKDWVSSIFLLFLMNCEVPCSNNEIIWPHTRQRLTNYFTILSETMSMRLNFSPEVLKGSILNFYLEGTTVCITLPANEQAHPCRYTHSHTHTLTLGTLAHSQTHSPTHTLTPRWSHSHPQTIKNTLINFKELDRMLGSWLLQKHQWIPHCH